MKGFFYLFMAGITYTAWYFRYFILAAALVFSINSCMNKPAAPTPARNTKSVAVEAIEEHSPHDCEANLPLRKITKEYYDAEGNRNPASPPEDAPRLGKNREKEFGDTSVIVENIFDYSDSIHMSVYQTCPDCNVSPSASMPKVYAPWYCHHYPNGYVGCEWQVLFSEYGGGEEECFELSSWNRETCKWERHKNLDYCEKSEKKL
jgi:hypothetical protein